MHAHATLYFARDLYRPYVHRQAFDRTECRVSGNGRVIEINLRHTTRRTSATPLAERFTPLDWTGPHALCDNLKTRHYAKSHLTLTSPKASSSLVITYDPQPGVVREQYPRTAMCVRNVNVHVSCSSHVDAQLAAFFIDPRAK